MDEGRIATKYAKALYSWAEKQHIGEQVYQESQAILPALEGVRTEFNHLFGSAHIQQSQRLHVVDRLFTRFAPSLSPFAALMVRNGRGLFLELAIRIFLDVYRKAKQIVFVRLITVSEATSKQKAEVEAFVKHTYHAAHVTLENVLQPKIIGGFQLEVDGKLLDRSVSTALQLFSRVD